MRNFALDLIFCNIELMLFPILEGASVSCDFESNYLCGYSAMISEGELVKTFLPQQGHENPDSNNGPSVDHTLGTIYGKN